MASNIPPEVMKAWMDYHANKEALQEPPIDPIELLSPGGSFGLMGGLRRIGSMLTKKPIQEIGKKIPNVERQVAPSQLALPMSKSEIPIPMSGSSPLIPVGPLRDLSLPREVGPREVMDKAIMRTRKYALPPMVWYGGTKPGPHILSRQEKSMYDRLKNILDGTKSKSKRSLLKIEMDKIINNSETMRTGYLPQDSEAYLKHIELSGGGK